MDDIIFLIDHMDREETVNKHDPKSLWQDNVARFCFAAARLPAPVLEGFLELMETYDASQDMDTTGACGHA